MGILCIKYSVLKLQNDHNSLKTELGIVKNQDNTDHVLTIVFHK